jgi:hypothetical protein
MDISDGIPNSEELDPLLPAKYLTKYIYLYKSPGLLLSTCHGDALNFFGRNAEMCFRSLVCLNTPSADVIPKE